GNRLVDRALAVHHARVEVQRRADVLGVGRRGRGVARDRERDAAVERLVTEAPGPAHLQRRVGAQVHHVRVADRLRGAGGGGRRRAHEHLLPVARGGGLVVGGGERVAVVAGAVDL